ncbi:hypothetical protein KCP74_22475 [Salmonella enterica subsp. enterica]|nr:hypothetical protein KCP74_22475 [Salmonella enterica subsp. enterica]
MTYICSIIASLSTSVKLAAGELSSRRIADIHHYAGVRRAAPVHPAAGKASGWYKTAGGNQNPDRVISRLPPASPERFGVNMISRRRR